jgi:poly(3-hydroxybutyrate) depolymerase
VRVIIIVRVHARSFVLQASVGVVGRLCYMVVCASVALWVFTHLKHSSQPSKHGTLSKRTILIEDPGLGIVNRTFFIQSPVNSTLGPMPVLMGFHGQGHRANEWANQHSFDLLASMRGWVTVYPQGMADGGSGTFDAGWNVGTNDDNSTCLPGTTGTGCHDSCRTLNLCGRCAWSTCYDDRAFVEQLLAQVKSELRVDEARVFAVGESNGAMLIHYLAASLPGTFAAAVPVFGSPLLGYLTGPAYQLVTDSRVRRTSVLQLHDRSDTTIPWQGANSADGWLYEPMMRSLGTWAALHGCAIAVTADPVPTGDPTTHTACFWHKGCLGGNFVGYCMYDGNHGDWPSQPFADQFIWHFLTNVSARESRLLEMERYIAHTETF